jgi:hypothetical protein
MIQMHKESKSQSMGKKPIQTVKINLVDPKFKLQE